MTVADSRDVSVGDGDPRVYFAAERTLLAWVRTGLAMMGFGLVVAKFGLFLREIAAAQGLPAPRQTGASALFGTVLIVFGAAAVWGGALNHWRTIRRLERGEPLRFGAFSLGFAVAASLGLFGLAAAAYLVLQDGPH